MEGSNWWSLGEKALGVGGTLKDGKEKENMGQQNFFYKNRPKTS